MNTRANDASEDIVEECIREARVGTIRKTTNGHHQLALALTHHGVREKRKKLQEEKSVKNTSSTCSIIRKMPQKPTESDLKIWYSSISQNVRKISSQ